MNFLFLLLFAFHAMGHSYLTSLKPLLRGKVPAGTEVQVRQIMNHWSEDVPGRYFTMPAMVGVFSRLAHQGAEIEIEFEVFEGGNPRSVFNQPPLRTLKGPIEKVVVSGIQDQPSLNMIFSKVFVQGEGVFIDRIRALRILTNLPRVTKQIEAARETAPTLFMSSTELSDREFLNEYWQRTELAHYQSQIEAEARSVLSARDLSRQKFKDGILVGMVDPITPQMAPDLTVSVGGHRSIYDSVQSQLQLESFRTLNEERNWKGLAYTDKLCDEFMTHVCAHYSDVVVLVPNRVFSYPEKGATQREVMWLLERPQAMSRCHFVFGVYAM